MTPRQTGSLVPNERSPAAVMGPRAERTRALILDTARSVFLQKGYGGTRIENITEAAQISRASFYTYFPTKRDLLLALGSDSFAAADVALRQLEEMGPGWTDHDLETWVRTMLAFLEEHGAFLLVWGQAKSEDSELNRVGRKQRLRHTRRFGEALARLRGGGGGDPTAEGLAVEAMLERFWYFWRVEGAPFSERQVVDTLVGIVSAILRQH